jgi:hypothetical protein
MRRADDEIEEADPQPPGGRGQEEYGPDYEQMPARREGERKNEVSKIRRVPNRFAYQGQDHFNEWMHKRRQGRWGEQAPDYERPGNEEERDMRDESGPPGDERWGNVQRREHHRGTEMHENRRPSESQPLDVQSPEFIERLENAHLHMEETNMVDLELVKGYVYEMLSRRLKHFMVFEEQVSILWGEGKAGLDANNYEQRYVFVLKQIVMELCNIFRNVLGHPEPEPRAQVFNGMIAHIQKFVFGGPPHGIQPADPGPEGDEEGLMLTRIGHTAGGKKASPPLLQSSSQTLEQRAAKRLERMGYKPAQERQEAGAEY